MTSLNGLSCDWSVAAGCGSIASFPDRPLNGSLRAWPASMCSLYPSFPRHSLQITRRAIQQPVLKRPWSGRSEWMTRLSTWTKGKGVVGHPAHNEAELQFDGFIGIWSGTSVFQRTVRASLWCPVSGCISYAVGTGEKSGGAKFMFCLVRRMQSVSVCPGNVQLHSEVDLAEWCF